MDVESGLADQERLDSWKEIGAFFGRDERTVKRWERERGLPVHRVPGSGRGRVFAYKAELKQWLQNAGSDAAVMATELGAEAPSSPRFHAEATAHRGENHATEGALALDPDAADEDRPPASDRPRLTVASRQHEAPPAEPVSALKRPRAVLWASAAALLVAATLVGFFLTRAHARQVANAALPQTDPVSRDFYLKGVYYWQKRTPEALHQAVDQFTQAIVHDPSYAPAYAGLAECYDLLREYDTMPPSEAYPRAIEAAQRAIQLDPHSAVGYRALAFATFWWKWDVNGARQLFERAIQEDPKSATSHHWYATFLATIGDTQKALQEIDTARELDPSSISIQADRGWILQIAGRVVEAKQVLEALEASDPSFASTHKYLASTYLALGDDKSFVREEQLVSAPGISGNATAAAAERGLKAGSHATMLQAIYEDTRARYAAGKTTAADAAYWAAAAGQYPEAYRLWQRAVEQHDPEVLALNLLNVLNGHHADPEFMKLEREIGLPPIP